MDTFSMVFNEVWPPCIMAHSVDGMKVRGLVKYWS